MFPNSALVKNLNYGGFAVKNATYINQSTFTSTRNKVINGDLDIWQRGTSFTPNPGYTADRVLKSHDGSGFTMTASQQSHTLGQTAVPGNPKYFHRLVQSVAGSGATVSNIIHRIESVKTLAGRTTTLTLYCQFASANTLPSIVIQQYFGSGGSPSAVVNALVTSSIAVGTTWQKVQYVFTMPSISGKTLGTNGDDYVSIYINVPLNTTFTFDHSHVSLVEGDASKETDPFSARHIAHELLLCQRFLCTIGGTAAYERAGAGMCVTSTTTARITVPLQTQMRSPPTLTYSAVTDWLLYNGSNIAISAITMDQASIRAPDITVTCAGLVNKAGYQMTANATLSARLYFSADL